MYTVDHKGHQDLTILFSAVLRAEKRLV